MDILQAIILGLVQGLTEFIPVSSSGHLILMHSALGIKETGLTFDVALHIGTLCALLLFFWKDLWQLLLGLFGKSDRSRLAWLLLAATIPAVIIGVLLESAAESSFRSTRLVAVNLMVVAVIMLATERFVLTHPHRTKLKDTTAKQALTMGLAQAAAIVPGVSRSGSTITAGLFMGLDRVSATRFSFLLGVPITAGAILKVLVSDSAASQISEERTMFLVGIVTAFLSGLVAIRFLLRYLAKNNLAVFAYYRLALGAGVLLLSVLR